MDDKEIREKALRVLLNARLGREDVSGDELVAALSAANLLMTADALEAMEACVRFKEKYLPMSRQFVLDKDVWMRVWDAGDRIIAKREQEKGPRYVVERLGGFPVVRDTQTAPGVLPYSFTESQAKVVCEALNKHAGEK